MPYRDTWATCEKCGKQFIFTVEEQRRLAELGFEVEATLCPDCQKEADLSPGRHTGVVKWYDSEKKYGFIALGSGKEVFFHRSNIAADEKPHFPDGTRVTLRLVRTQKGPEAVDVARSGSKQTQER